MRERARETWKNLLKIEKNRYSIFIFSTQFRGTIEYSLAVVRGEDTILKQNKQNKIKMPWSTLKRKITSSEIQVPEGQHFTDWLCRRHVHK
jgi:hypothetical protein